MTLVFQGEKKIHDAYIKKSKALVNFLKSCFARENEIVKCI